MSTDLDTDVRLHIYRHLADRGRAPSADETAEALGLTAAEVAGSYGRLAEAHVIVLEPGTSDVWMAAPFSGKPTPFRVRSGDRAWFGNCVWDALAILPMLGVDGAVTTACPDCDAPLALEVAEGRLRAPDGAIAHFAVPARRWWEDVGFT